MKMRALAFLIATGLVQVTCAAQPALAQMHQMPSGAVKLDASTTVPFALAGGHIYIAAKINGHPYAFVFDTGGQAGITHEVETALQLPVLGHADIPEAGGASLSTDLVRLDNVSIGKAQYTGATAIVLPRGFPHANPIPGLPYGGIIGREFFARLVTTIDYQHRTLSFAQPSAFKPDAAAVVLPLTLRNGVFPNVSGSINGREGNFDVDAGAPGAIILTQSFAHENNIQARGRTVVTDIGRGLGGYIVGTAMRASTLRLGALQMQGPIGTVAGASAGYFSEADFAGNIGTQVLRRFTLTLDVPASRLYLVPNSSLSAPFVFNRSGMTVRIEGGLVKIVSVLPDSPSLDARVRPGDVITAVDGKSISSISSAQLVEDWLRPAGTAIKLMLRRDGRSVPATIVLRDII